MAPPSRDSALSRPRGAAVAIALLALAAALRLWRIGWGLDEGVSWEDERLFWLGWLSTFARPTTSCLLPGSLIYPPLYGYVSGAVFAIAVALGLVSPSATPPHLEALLVARVVSAVASVVGVALTGLVAKRIAGPRAGLVALALAAVVPLDAMQVHYASVDPLLTTITAATLLVTLRLARTPTVALAASAGLLVGLAVATKYTAILLAAPVAWAILVEAPLAGVGIRRIATLAVAAALGALVGAATGCPSCFLESHKLLAAIAMHRRMVAWAGFPTDHLVPTLGWYGRPWLYQLIASLPFLLGLPLYLLVLVGVARSVMRHDRDDRVLLAFVVAWFGVVAASRVTFARYLLPLVPALVPLAARVLTERRGGVAIAVAATLYGTVLATSQVARFSWGSQSAVAAWIGSNVRRPDEKPLTVEFVSMLKGGYYRLGRPLRRAGFDVTERQDARWLESRPDVFVLPDWHAMALRRDSPRSPATRSLDRVERGKTDYVLAHAIPSRWYLQRRWDEWIDPGLATQLYQGDLGFRVYVRRDLRPETGYPAAP